MHNVHWNSTVERIESSCKMHRPVPAYFDYKKVMRARRVVRVSYIVTMVPRLGFLPASKTVQSRGRRND